jgi:hypothetical protein
MRLESSLHRGEVPPRSQLWKLLYCAVFYRVFLERCNQARYVERRWEDLSRDADLSGVSSGLVDSVLFAMFGVYTNCGKPRDLGTSRAVKKAEMAVEGNRLRMAFVRVCPSIRDAFMRFFYIVVFNCVIV